MLFVKHLNLCIHFYNLLVNLIYDVIGDYDNDCKHYFNNLTEINIYPKWL